MIKADQLAPKIVHQLAVFLENKPGALATVCDALAEAKINIFGLSVSDTTDHSVVRMVLSNSDRAMGIFEEHGALIVESEVLMIQNDNKPGSLSRIAKALAEKKINIDYGYLASMPSAKRGLLILRVTDAKKALGILKKLDQAV
ncbi:MAG: ACT domain-containing protein [bacterium]